MQESPGLNPECLGEIGLSKKYFNMLTYTMCWKTLLQIGRRETGQ